MKTTRAIGLVGGLLALGAAGAYAQTGTPKVFFACYVPSLAGTTYRIKEPGLSTKCLLPSHVQFSWTDGVAANDHGTLNGLADDDHPQYLLTSGARALAGHLNLAGFKLIGLAAGSQAGDAVRFEQAVKATDAAGGDVSGPFSALIVSRLQGLPLSTLPPADGQVLAWNGTTWGPATIAGAPTGTPANIPGAIVQRDASGGFAAGPVDVAQLNVGGHTTVGGDANVGGNANVGGSASVGGNASVSGSAEVTGSATVHGPTTLAGLNVGGSAAVLGTMSVQGATSLSTGLTVGSNANIGGVVGVGGQLTAGGMISTAGGYRFPDGTVQTTAATGSGGVSDHGALGGLGADDHPQYLLASGARPLAGSLDASGFRITGLGAGTMAGDAVRFEQAVKVGDAASGDLSGSYPAPTVVALRSFAVSGEQPTNGQVLTWDGEKTSSWRPVTLPVASVTSHGDLIGLLLDDHPQYLLTDGTRPLAGPFNFNGFGIRGLAPGTLNGDAVIFEQAVKVNDAAGGDLSGSYPSPTVAMLRNRPLAITAPSNGQVLTWDGLAWAPATPTGGVTDHGALTGLTDDDHSQYLLADGVRPSTNGFAVTGNIGVGGIPATGPGARLMWYPAKAAFRAGYAPGPQWDNANVGLQSVALGYQTTASGPQSTAVGDATTASGDASTAMGGGTVASGPGSTAMGQATTASGSFSTAMGLGTTASGNLTTAMGTGASTNMMVGSFVYGDASASATQAMAPNSFVVRAQRVWLGKAGNQIATVGHYLETSTGAYLSDGGAWTNASDVDRKENFETLDGDEVLDRLSRLSVGTWNYRAEDPGVRHLGPTAQDFYTAFRLGDSDKSISTVDASGVALLAIQALERRMREQASEIAALRAELAALRAQTRSSK